MQKALILNPEKCTGCRTCEAVCSLFHEGRVNPTESRISVVKYEEEGVFIPLFCQHCQNPICEEVCPVAALYSDPATGAMLIKETRCLGCKLCIMACPIGGPSLHPLTKKIIKCDLCNGKPQCAAFCYDGALEFVDLDEVGVKKRRDSTKSFAAFITTQQRGGKA